MTAKVLYLSYDGMTDPLGQSQVLPYLSGLARELEIEFHLISFEKPDKFQQSQQSIQQFCDQTSIKWYPQVYHKSPPVFSTLYDLYQLFRLSSKICETEDIQIVHARSYLPAMIAVKLKARYGLKFIFDIRGFWIEERVEGGLWNLNNPIFKVIHGFMKRKENELYTAADTIVTLTHRAKEIVASNFKVSDSIEVIPCAVDLDHFKPQSETVRSQVRKKLGLSNASLALVYVGSLGTWYQLDEMLDFFKVLSQVQPNAKFFFFTLDQPEMIRSKADELGISPVDIHIQAVSRKEMPSYLSAMDAAIFFIRPTYSKMASSPTKHGELLAMELPVICNDVGDLSLICSRENTGLIIQDYTSFDYQTAIQHLLSNQFGGFKEVTEEFYDLKKGVRKYNGIYTSLLES